METDRDGVLVACSQRDARAFAALYDRYFPAVYGYCLSELRDTEAAADAASQTFLRALAALPGYQEAGRFRSWLFAIAHNVVLDAVRGRRPDAPLESATGIVDPGATPEELATAALDLARLDEAIARLPAEDRRVLELRLAGLTGREIGTVLWITHEAAKKRQLWALDRLEAELSAPTVGGVRRGT